MHNALSGAGCASHKLSMSESPKRRLIPWKGSTLVVIAFLVLTILPAFIAFALTSPDAKVVTNVQGWNGCAYTVRRGDNLFRIGVRYGVSSQYLAQMNGIYNADYIWAGQLISVPCGAVPYPNYIPSAQKYAPYQCPWCQPFDIPADCAQNLVNYQVQPGDNLFRIAVNNGSTIQWIRTQNNLWGKVLRSGTTVAVPCFGKVKYGANIFTPTPGGPEIITETPPVVASTTPQNNNINMSSNRFRPRRLEVKVGTTVTWTNAEASGGPAYNITSGANGTPDGNFSSGTIAPGGVYQFTFSISGSYSYYSTTDPVNMTGEVIVSP